MARRFETFGRYVDRCESPLERRFLIALLFSEAFAFRPVTGRRHAEIAEDESGIILGQQVRVGDYRVDFAMKRVGGARRIAIEVDGRTYHSSPEAVESDKIRDRVLLGCGWSTMRFTSKEVIQDAVGCARQAYEIALRLPPGNAPPLARASARTHQLLLPAPSAARAG